jgi:hypothetical protein
VKLILYNSKNKKVKKIVAKIQMAGTYEIHLSRNGLNEKHYYYELRAVAFPFGFRDLFKDMKRMVISM